MNRVAEEELELARTLAAIDVDGALRETAASAFPTSRGDFLRSALAGGAAAIGALGVAGRAGAAASRSRGDIAILRFDLVLEYLQAALYTEAERIGALSEKTLGWARVVGAHERAHAQAIKALLGRQAVSQPSFDFYGVTARERPFIKTAVAFEELTAAILKWQAERLDSREVLAAVATLHSVETRHAAWIRHIVGLQPAASAFDEPAAQSRMARLIASTHFVTSRPRTTGKSRPRFTG
ncbi:MAG: ferritin-like domain-containing protein [Gaiellaceae bacterium]